MASQQLLVKLNEIVNDPKYHDLLSILRGTRNGIVYGAKLRFCHALVMSFLFRSGPFKDRWSVIIKNTKQHAKALGSFVFLYKTTLYLLKLLRNSSFLHQLLARQTNTRPNPKLLSSTTIASDINNHTNGLDAFIAGLVAGYIVFGRAAPGAGLSSINQQMVLYVFSRIFLGICKLVLDRILLYLSENKPSALLPRPAGLGTANLSGSTTPAGQARGPAAHKHTKHIKGAIGIIDFATQVRRLSPTARTISNAAWAAFASASWGIVMYLFRKDSTLLQSSMIHSMKYLYVDSESWSSLWDILF